MLRPLRLVLAAASLVGCAGCPHPTAPPAGPHTPTPPHSHTSTRRPHPLALTDVTEHAGITFKHHTGAFGRKWFPETNGSGVALFDYDGDGFPDLFLVDSRAWGPAERKAAGLPPGAPPPPTPSRLYRNLGNGAFQDVTSETGVGVPMYGMGCAVADYDNDGWLDLYVTAVGRSYLFHNEGGRRFREIAANAGVIGSGWGSSAAWVDYDRDGLLDLFVGHYVDWDPKDDRPCLGAGDRSVYCGPNVYRPEPCRLYHQKADHTFADVSKQAGVQMHAGNLLHSKAMGVAILDVDRDGWLDLAVANDTEANFLFRNNHDGTLTEQGMERGIALPPGGEARSGMGIDAGDWDGSGGESLLIGNFVEEMLGLYRPDRDGLFTDQAGPTGAGSASRSYTTFGCLWVDLDNDGWLDVTTANGHIDDKAEQGTPVALKQRPLFLLNEDGKHFKEAPLYATPVIGRGLAAGDLDRDGAVDVVITTNDGPPVILHNDGRIGNSVRLVLEGTRCNRSAIGAEVEARVGGMTLRRRVKSGSSYLSASELPLTLGLGKARRVDSLTIRWPDGTSEAGGPLEAGSEYRIKQGGGPPTARPL